MPDVFRVVAVWGGFAGSPGYSNLYFNAPLVGTFAAQGAVNATRQFFEELKAGIPLGVTIQVDSAVAQIDEETGVQNDEFVVATPAPVVTAAGAATRAAPVGGRPTGGSLPTVTTSTSSSPAEGPGEAVPAPSPLGAFLASLVAFLAPGAAVLGAAVLVSSVGGETITQGEWVTAAVAAIVASAAGEARAARRVGAETRRGEATAQRLKDDSA